MPPHHTSYAVELRELCQAQSTVQICPELKKDRKELASGYASTRAYLAGKGEHPMHAAAGRNKPATTPLKPLWKDVGKTCG